MPLPHAQRRFRHKIISFAIGDDQYGVDIMAVREIKGWSEITHLPRQPESVRGVLNLRGAIVPIIDLRCRFGQGLTEASAIHVVIIVQVGARVVGLLADRVLDIVSFDTAQVQPVPKIAQASRIDFLSGLVTVDTSMIALIDLNNLLSLPVGDAGASADELVSPSHLVLRLYRSLKARRHPLGCDRKHPCVSIIVRRDQNHRREFQESMSRSVHNVVPDITVDEPEREFTFSDADFRNLVQLAYEYAGIALSDTKRNLVYTRVSRRLRALGLNSFRDYRAYLSENAPERENFVNAISTNLTRFFREIASLRTFQPPCRRPVPCWHAAKWRTFPCLVGGVFNGRGALHDCCCSQARNRRCQPSRCAYSRDRYRHRRTQESCGRRVSRKISGRYSAAISRLFSTGRPQP